ncbi:HEPN domain-containing protein [uncultured Psychromonas sp.]|uniref:HEPN domain-containing protein n=1 Tax=uncultured Psychromonas sp. TaxID=173974 RepID=UPI002609216C|nr:HEPN domain-containing protein [uncultured Psychromonas sp.]
MWKHEHTISIHKLYYKIAKKGIECYKKLDHDLSNEENRYCAESEINEIWEKTELLYEGREVEAIKSITFAAMCLEAFLYDYAVYSQSKTFLDKKLSAKCKFVAYLEAVDNIKIESSSEIYKRVERLFALRNELVHFKSKKFKISELQDASEFHEKLNDQLGRGALDSLETVCLVMKYIDKYVGTQHYQVICVI